MTPERRQKLHRLANMLREASDLCSELTEPLPHGIEFADKLCPRGEKWGDWSRELFIMALDCKTLAVES